MSGWSPDPIRVPGWFDDGRSGGGFQGDLVAEGLQLADVVALGAFGTDAGVVEAGAEVVEPVGARYWVTSCDLRVLMDQPTETVVPDHPPTEATVGTAGWSQWWRLPQRPMGPMAVVVLGILTQQPDQVPTSKNKHPIQALTTHRAHPPLRVGIRPRCPHRRDQHLDPFGGKGPRRTRQ